MRLPLRPSSARGVANEHRWLPALAPQLPLAIPVPLALGAPTSEYSLPWSVFPWLPGEDGTTARFDRAIAAADLARFLRALWAIDTAGGPLAQDRGVPLAARDARTRAALEASRDLLDTAPLLACWERCVGVPPWDRPPVWVHGDLASGNLLFDGGRLTGVLDFACLGVGDPAVDLIPAWELLDAASRAEHRRMLRIDDATWERGRGWALSTAIIALPYYADTHPFMAEQARRKLAAVLT